MERKYCKLNNDSKIYLVEKIKNNKAFLCSQNIKVITDISNLTFVDNIYINACKTGKSSFNITSENVENEIMLRHKLKEEAISDLDKYIDQAIVAKLGRVRIIHGRHGGVLREAAHEYLKNHPYVKEYYLADYSEGGIGVTIAILGKRR